MKKEECTEQEIICNMCGKHIAVKQGIAAEDVLAVNKTWGYFSSRDGMQMRFHLCEDCCMRLLSEFCVPAAVTEAAELL